MRLAVMITCWKAVIAHADGTEEIIKSSVMGENGLLVTLEKDSTIKINV